MGRRERYFFSIVIWCHVVRRYWREWIIAFDAGILNCSQGRRSRLSRNSLPWWPLHQQVWRRMLTSIDAQPTWPYWINHSVPRCRQMDEKWGLNLPDFPGTDQCVRLSPASEAQTKTSVRNRMDDHFLHNVATQSLFRYLLIGTTSTELHRQSVTQPERRRACTNLFSRGI